MMLLFALWFASLLGSYTGCAFLFKVVPSHQSRLRSDLVLSASESQMNKYISDYLGRDDDSSSSHHELVLAMPCNACHELQVELESVQRAIIYHCPIAAHACLPGAILQLELLRLRSSQRFSTPSIERVVQECVSTMDDGGLQLQFEKLDISPGAMSENEVLRVAIEKDDEKDVRGLAERLRDALQSFDDSIECDIPKHFSLPFMQLPEDWKDVVEREKDGQDITHLTSDEGGNGISPIFWIQWSDDKFGGRQTLREIGLFQGSARFPLSLTQLPGCETLTPDEVHWKEYQDSRMKEIEESMRKEIDGGKSNDKSKLQSDPLFQKTKERLELIYSSGEPIVDRDDDDERETEWADIQEDLLEAPQRDNDPESVDQWTRDRIRRIIENKKRKTTPSIQVQPRKDLPPIEENEVLRKFSEQQKASYNEPKTKRILPPFPSPEHCIGFWEMIESPTGFEVETGNPTQSDNLILRADRGVAGGPILDQETRQKAAGGMWEVDGHKLYIELLIPPEKERVLVLRGTIEQPSIPSLPMTRNTFGIPELEALKERTTQHDEEEVYCTGKVWLHDVGTKLNRNEIGTFAMKKLKYSEGGYFIDVPGNSRLLD